jgi:hypothetical protein
MTSVHIQLLPDYVDPFRLAEISEEFSHSSITCPMYVYVRLMLYHIIRDIYIYIYIWIGEVVLNVTICNKATFVLCMWCNIHRYYVSHQHSCPLSSQALHTDKLYCVTHIWGYSSTKWLLHLHYIPFRGIINNNVVSIPGSRPKCSYLKNYYLSHAGWFCRGWM